MYWPGGRLRLRPVMLTVNPSAFAHGFGEQDPCWLPPPPPPPPDEVFDLLPPAETAMMMMTIRTIKPRHPMPMFRTMCPFFGATAAACAAGALGTHCVP